MSPYRIPFNKPHIAGNEYAYIAEALSRMHVSGDGEFTRRCGAFLEESTGARRALLTPSCTHALEIAALLLDLKPGDEVIVPSFTFVSTANAFALHGARPVFADVRPDTLNLDERTWETKITPRTRAVVPVHYGGVACDMDALVPAARKRGIRVVEDNAHGLFGTYRERPLGSLGDLAALSFHETKNFICGEGGALLVNAPEFVERADVLRQKGTDRTRFLEGRVDKYTWIDVGSSYVLSDLLAAFLFAQFERREQIQSRRRRIWERYRSALADWAADRGVVLPTVPDDCAPTYHLFHLLMPSLEARRSLIEHLEKRGIMAVFHYVPLHLSAMGRKFGGAPKDCPVTESVCDRLVRLPFFNDLTEAEQGIVIDSVRDWR